MTTEEIVKIKEEIIITDKKIKENEKQLNLQKSFIEEIKSNPNFPENEIKNQINKKNEFIIEIRRLENKKKRLENSLQEEVERI